MRVLEAFNLYRFYHTGEEETLALCGVSIHIAIGEIVAVTGPSGSGKTTLLSCLSGLDEPDGGFVTFMGKRLTRCPERERAAVRAAGMGIVLQSGNLFDHLSVEDNVRLQMRLANSMDEARLTELLTLVGLQNRRTACPSQLSGGEAARAALAVAMANNPKVLLADEPTGEVDATTEKLLLDLLDKFRKNGGAVLVATHSDALAARADRIVRLRDGKVVHYD